MKPEQFIREFGVEKAREVVEGAPDLSLFYDLEKQKHVLKESTSIAMAFLKNRFLPIADLKRLVESLEIIETVGYDRDGAEEIYEFSKDCEVIHYAGLEIKVTRLAQAIRDHESIYGGGDE
ncbi:hypothetical protein ACOCI4_01875 [Acinetobacter baumannii]|uniref:hypothetical protein n=1 Tax=Acinetobacter baumannii TaxID=470 RepID=UPI003B42AB51